MELCPYHRRRMKNRWCTLKRKKRGQEIKMIFKLMMMTVRISRLEKLSALLEFSNKTQRER